MRETLRAIKTGAQNQIAGTALDMQTGDFGRVKEDLKSAARAGQFGGVDSLVPLALSIVILAIVVGLGALILNEMENTTTDADATGVLNTGVTALQDFADFFTIIVVVGVAAVIFLLLRVVRNSGRAAAR